VNESANTITFQHPKLSPLTINPDLATDSAKLVAWTKPIMPTDRAASDRIVRAPDRGMTDTPFPSISINSNASLADFSNTAGTELSRLRWRGNIWISGATPWDEFNWIGRHARIGNALLKIVEPITRCPATTANPTTGKRDVDTLKFLSETYGHKDFGIYAEVVESGEIKTGDELELV
jgi:uncharacterized protein YcbX